MQASDIPFARGKGPAIHDHIFRERGDQRYSLDLLPAGITFEVDRLRRNSHELIGELAVRVNGNFPLARTVDGVLSIGDLNFSSVVARSTRAKLLASRSAADDLDWYGFLEEFAVKVIGAERAGKPAVMLADEPEPAANSDIWTVAGWPMLRELPMVLFGDSENGKSYFAMWIAGQMARQGISVLYADWEFAKSEHRNRLRRLFEPMPKFPYLRCDRPIRDELDRLRRTIQEHHCQYLICDSIGFAVEGPAEAHEGAGAYFRALRQLGIGSLNIGHIPKQTDETKQAQIFGSIWFKHGARSVWFIARAEENPPGELRFGLYHRKNNIGEHAAPRAFKLVFRGDRTLVEPIALESVDELTVSLSLLDRMKRRLTEPLSIRDLAEAVNASPAAVRQAIARHHSLFGKAGHKIRLIEPGLTF